MINNASELAQLIGVSEFGLFRYALRNKSFYRQFAIPKKCGGERMISAPSRGLKNIQRWIASNLLAAQPLADCVTGYRRGTSIVANACPHSDKDFVFNADIKDFFGSIKATRVYSLFRCLGYSPPIARLLSRLTTHRGCLPQGAPTSPAIANLVCLRLDDRLSRFCQRRQWSYTRYCDDITISGDGQLGSAREKIVEIIESEGFQLNPKKIRLATRRSRQEVTGLVVNAYPNINRAQRRRLRAIFHQASLWPRHFAAMAKELQGKLAFLQMIRPNDPNLTTYKQIVARLEAD
jgi:retron-type reverse transcriptase